MAKVARSADSVPDDLPNPENRGLNPSFYALKPLQSVSQSLTGQQKKILTTS